MNISKEQIDASIIFLQEKLAKDTAHINEYTTAINAINAVNNINNAIVELEKLKKENWDKSSSNYCWGASDAFGTSISMIKKNLSDCK